MKLKRTIIVFDAPDLAVESSFWAALLDGKAIPEDDEGWHSVVVDGEWVMGFQHAPNYVRPEWPDGEQQQQIHLDLWVEDIDAAHQKASALGAAHLKTVRNDAGTEEFRVFSDPAGHPFCFCWAAGMQEG